MAAAAAAIDVPRVNPIRRGLAVGMETGSETVEQTGTATGHRGYAWRRRMRGAAIRIINWRSRSEGLQRYTRGLKRMQFTKDLELQRLKLLMESQVQLEKLKRSMINLKADVLCRKEWKALSLCWMLDVSDPVEETCLLCRQDQAKLKLSQSDAKLVP